MSAASRRVTFGRAINEALREKMRRDPGVFLLGQDVGRMGGLFKVSEGLLKEFGPERVMDAHFRSGHRGNGYRRSAHGHAPCC